MLSKLACGADATVHVARGLARRDLVGGDCLYAQLLAARLVGDGCTPAAGLPDKIRAYLKQLAAKNSTTQREAGAAPAEVSERSSGNK